jgi:hypothetical protein
MNPNNYQLEMHGITLFILLTSILAVQCFPTNALFTTKQPLVKRWFGKAIEKLHDASNAAKKGKLISSVAATPPLTDAFKAAKVTKAGSISIAATRVTTAARKLVKVVKEGKAAGSYWDKFKFWKKKSPKSSIKHSIHGPPKTKARSLEIPSDAGTGSLPYPIKKKSTSPLNNPVCKRGLLFRRGQGCSRTVHPAPPTALNVPPPPRPNGTLLRQIEGNATEAQRAEGQLRAAQMSARRAEARVARAAAAQL